MVLSWTRRRIICDLRLFCVWDSLTLSRSLWNPALRLSQYPFLQGDADLHMWFFLTGAIPLCSFGQCSGPLFDFSYFVGPCKIYRSVSALSTSVELTFVTRPLFSNLWRTSYRCLAFGRHVYFRFDLGPWRII